jgi:hypothetical protein
MSTTAHKILALGSLVGMLNSCSAPRTQIVVLVDTDFAVPSEVGSLRVTVRDPNGGEDEVRSITLAAVSGAECAESNRSTRFCLPLSFLVVPKERRPQDASVELTVDGVEGADALTGRVLVSVRARLGFLPGRTLQLPLFLSRSCEQVVCPSGQTCVEDGVCAPIERPIGVTVIDPRTGMTLDAGLDAGDASEPLDVRSRRRDGGADGGSGRDAADSSIFDGGEDVARDAMRDVVRDAMRDVARDTTRDDVPDNVPGDVPGDAYLARQSWCGSRCVNLLSSESHCGRCNNRCIDPAVCTDGQCR